MVTDECQVDSIQVSTPSTSTVEYASCPWDTSTYQEIKALEMVQSYGVKIILGFKERYYE